MYQDGDDLPLEGGAHLDLNEAELVGSTDRVQIVSQYDRYEGGFDGDGDWTGARRYYVTKDNYLDVIASQMVDDLGEVDSGDTQTLIEFAVWAIQSYPADRIVLILSDHGGGWTGGWRDYVPVEGSGMTMNEIDQALGEIIRQTGIFQFELVGFDACLMAQVESLSALAPYARFAVASEENVPGIGLGYTTPLDALAQRPEMSGDELARLFVDAYIEKDAFIVSDAGRPDLAQSRGLPRTASVEDVVATYGDTTMTAVDLANLDELAVAINALAVALSLVDQSQVAEARSYAQSFSSIFGTDVPNSYLDLGHFASLLQERFQDNAEVAAALQQVQAALQQTVLAEKHGPQRPGATGISIFFPNSRLFEVTFSPEQVDNYTASASRFATSSLWDEYVYLHYTGQGFDSAAVDVAVLQPEAAGPVLETPPALDPPQEIVAPGAGEVNIAPITLSADQILNTESVTLTTVINGSNIAFLYNYVFWLDEASGDYQTVDIDYITADAVRELNGVTFPDWSATPIDLDLEWTPQIFYISNGEEEIFAVLEPELYGAAAEDTFYLVDGFLTEAASGAVRSGYIRFNGVGEMNSVWIYTDDNQTGTPSEIYPIAGDSFTVTDYWLEFGDNPDGELVEYSGGSITFGDAPLTWSGYAPIGGTYLVGIVVEDMDGNYTFEFVPILVTEE
jgi:hypothetical protein